MKQKNFHFKAKNSNGERTKVLIWMFPSILIPKIKMLHWTSQKTINQQNEDTDRKDQQ